MIYLKRDSSSEKLNDSKGKRSQLSCCQEQRRKKNLNLKFRSSPELQSFISKEERDTRREECQTEERRDRLLEDTFSRTILGSSL